MSIYLELTESFNQSRIRAVICSGQAVVLHRLAVMSKDGDWILREEQETLDHVLAVLEEHGAVYRFGAPLDLRWLQAGWSSHLEFEHEGIRVRTDFFTRPPRISEADLTRIWEEAENQRPPFTTAVDLARIKMTQREKDYPVIGELARIMPEIEDQLRFSRSARDLIRLAAEHPKQAAALSAERPLLALAAGSNADEDELAAALDAERRKLIKADRERLAAYENAALPWRERWPKIKSPVAEVPLREAHEFMVSEASGSLPTNFD